MGEGTVWGWGQMEGRKGNKRIKWGVNVLKILQMHA
jgi:hypothetical protein